MKKGAFAFVLPSHMPYFRRCGLWPLGEGLIYETLAETYIPLLDLLYSLRDEGCPFKLTLGMTPLLVEQLSNPFVVEHFKVFMEEHISRAEGDKRRFESGGEGHLAYLAGFYLDRYREVLRSFEERFERNPVRAFRLLQDEGYLEILASAASHAYLPLLGRDSSIFAQLKAGRDSFLMAFGREPRATWLPGCGYRPAVSISRGEGKYTRPGIEAFLAELNIGLFFCETHAIEGGEPVGKARGEVFGPSGAIPKRYSVPPANYVEPTQKTTYLPYWSQRPGVAVLGRNNPAGMQVWSSGWGYPGDFNYREMQRRHGISGLRYWRVTGAKLDLSHKDYYDPYHAFVKAREHAAHFSTLAESLVGRFYQDSQKFGIIVAAFDAWLFGHWWFEGIEWLGGVLRRLARSEVLELSTGSEYLEKHPPEEALALPESSWGQGGAHFPWLNVDTEGMWPLVHQSELRMEGLVSRFPRAEGRLAGVLNQAARELLLLQSSDWPFLVTTGLGREYGALRFQEHLSAFNQLADIAQSDHVNDAEYSCFQELWKMDRVFPGIDYRDFKSREGPHIEYRIQ